MKQGKYSAGQLFVSNSSERSMVLLCRSDLWFEDICPIWTVVEFSEKRHGRKSSVRESTLDKFFKPIEEVAE